MSVKVKFNIDAIKGMKKDEFIKAHKHLSGFVNLEEEYDKIVPPKKKKEEE